MTIPRVRRKAVRGGCPGRQCKSALSRGRRRNGYKAEPTKERFHARCFGSVLRSRENWGIRHGGSGVACNEEICREQSPGEWTAKAGGGGGF